MNKIETRRFWLGAILMLSGVVLLFIALFVDPRGEIHGSVLGAFGEIATLSGALVGCDVYVNYKIRKAINTEKNINSNEQE